MQGSPITLNKTINTAYTAGSSPFNDLLAADINARFDSAVRISTQTSVAVDVILRMNSINHKLGTTTAGEMFKTSVAVAKDQAMNIRFSADTNVDYLCLQEIDTAVL